MGEACTNDVTMGGLIWDYILENKKLFAIYVLFILILPLQDVGMPHLFGKLVKAIQAKQGISLPLALIIAIIIALQIAYSLADYVEVHMFPAVQKFVRERMMTHIFKMQETNHEEMKTGEVTTKLIKMPALMYTFMEHWKNLYIPQAIVFIVAICYFLYHNWVVGVSLFALVVGLVTMIYNSIFVCEGVAMKRDWVYNQLYEEVDDVLRNVVSVLNNKQEREELDKINVLQEEYTRLSKDALTCAMRVRYTFLPIIVGYMAFFTYFMYKRVVSGDMEPGAFIAMFMIMVTLINSMWRIIGNVKDIVLKWGMIKETLEMFKVCQREREPVGDGHNPRLLGLVFKGVGCCIGVGGEKNEIFRGLDLHFVPGERVLVVGQIGAGKTTLLRLMMKYIQPSAGEIYLDGFPYAELGAGELRRVVGYIPQNPILFNRSIYDNVVYGIEGVSKADVEGVIQGLGLSEVFKRMPNGLETIVGKLGSRISGGQRQIVWILRTILQDPRYIMMDEPTAAIDEETKEVVHRLLQVAMRGKTVIMVTHDPFLLRFADRVIEVRHGEVVRDERRKA